ncbi:MAG: hypothetical protein KDE51_04335 [Anaerolineales bacterium]|nr:hypothetical protein [Anaerolineales bacterium]
MSRDMQKAIKAIKAGDMESGRKLLSTILKKDRNNEEAWLWMSRTMSEPQKKRQCIERVLSINPNNEVALRIIDRMDGRTAPPPTAAPAQPQTTKQQAPTPRKMPPPPSYVPQVTPQQQAKTRIIGIVAFLFAGLFLIGGLVAVGYGIVDANSFTLEKATAEVISWEIVETGSRANVNVDYSYEVDGELYERSQRIKAADLTEAQAIVDQYGLDGYLPPSVYYEVGAPQAAEFTDVPPGLYDNLYVGGALIGVAVISAWLGIGLRGSIAKPKEEEMVVAPATAS